MIRAHLGLLLPVTNVVVEDEYQELVSLMPSSSRPVKHVARVGSSCHFAADPEAYLRELAQNLETAEATLPKDLDACAFFCTSSAVQEGIERPRLIVPGEALCVACAALRLERVAVLTPYPERIGVRVVRFLENRGLVVTGARHLGYVHTAEYLACPWEDLAVEAAQTVGAHADGVILSCTNVPSLRAIQRVEKRCRKALVSSNSATLWRMLCQAGVDTSLLIRFLGCLGGIPSGER